MKINTLLLSGGMSTRMGTPKHLLPFTDSKPLYVRLLHQLRNACPGALLFMSLRNPDQARQIDQSLHEDLKFIYDGDGSSDIGPAAGLLAAYDADPEAHWLVLACDYPHITASDLRALLEAYEAPVTCFLNEEGFHEPLVALWSPEALRKLRQNVSNGVNGPARTIKMLNGKRMRPEREMALFNANTPEEWETALQVARTLANVQPETV